MALTDFPPALRQLVEAELAAGNKIQSVGDGFPAPPAGERLYFVMTAPGPPPPEPDMDAIREAVNRPAPGHGRDPIT